MQELINFFFDVGDKEFIGVTKYGAFWTNGQQKLRLYFIKTFLKLMFSYISLCFR